MKKKLKSALSLLLCMIMVFGAVAVGGEGIELPSIKELFGSEAQAASEKYDIYAYEVGSDGTVTITDCDDSAQGAITIPSQIDGKAVTNIGNHAFANCDSISEIVFPSELGIIGGYSFENCTNLKNVTWNSKLKTIGEYAFKGCQNIESIILPNSIENIEQGAFCETGIKEIVIPASVSKMATRQTGMGGYTSGYVSALFGAKELRKVRFSDGMSTIPAGTLSKCDQIATAILPSTSTSIGEYAFFGCSSIQSFDFPSNVVNIGNHAFANCDSISEIVFPSELGIIGGYSFENCTNLKNVTWNSKLKTIGEYAFKGCQNIESIILPNSIENIEQGAFCETGIKEIVIPASVSKMATRQTGMGGYTSGYVSALFGAKELRKVRFSDGMSTIPAGTLSKCDQIATAILPSTSTSIGEYAFFGCSSIQSFDFPSNVVNIGNHAFANCDSISEIVFPSELGIIGGYSFENCTNLKNVTWNSKLKTIGEYAFKGCQNIESIILPNSIENIEQGAFCETGIKEIVIPASVSKMATRQTGMGGYTSGYVSALFGAKELRKVRFSDGMSTIPAGTLSKCDQIATAILPSTSTSIGEYAFFGCSSIQSFDFPSNVVNIGNHAFANCDSISEIVFPSELGIIGGYSFENCTNLKNVTWNSKLKTIGEYAFKGCQNIESIILPNSIENIEQGAFCETGIKEIVIPASVSKMATRQTGMGGYTSGYVSALFGAKELRKVRFSDGMSTIPAGTLSKCDQIATAILPSTSTSIGEYAFFGCTGLNAAYYLGTPEQWAKVSIGSNNDCLANCVIFDSGSSKSQTICGTLEDTIITTVINGSTSWIGGAIIGGKTYNLSRDSKYQSTISSYKAKKVVCTIQNDEIVWIKSVADIKTSISCSVESTSVTYSGKKYSSNTVDVWVKISNTLQEPDFIGDPAVLAGIPEFELIIPNAELKVDNKDIFSFNGKQTYSTPLNTVGLGQSKVFCVTANVKNKKPDNLPEIKIGVNCTFDITQGDKSFQKVAYGEFKIINEVIKEPTQENVTNSSDKEFMDALANAAQELKKATTAFTLEADISNSLGQIFTNQQLDFTAQIILCVAAMKGAPEETFSEELERKVIEKVFSINTRWLRLFNDKIVVTVAMKTQKYGVVQVEYTYNRQQAVLNDNPYAFYGDVEYKIIKSDKPLPNSVRRSGATGGIYMADMSAFCKAAYSVAESELKRSYNKAWGKDANKAADIIFGTSVNKILSKTDYKSFSGLAWAIMTAPAKKVEIKCPVDVYVYDKDNKLVASVEDNNVTLSNPNVDITVNGDTKTIMIYDESYRIEYRSAAEGTMDIVISEFGGYDQPLETTTFEKVPLKIGVSYTQNMDDTYMDESEYSLTSNEKSTILPTKIKADLHAHTSSSEWKIGREATHTEYGWKYNYCYECHEWYEAIIPKLTVSSKLSIKSPSTTTVSYGFTLNLHANVTDLPEGARVEWSMSGSGFELIPSADGMTCGVKSVSKGSATITAKVVDKNSNAVKDANGNEITASQQLTSKAGFFQKLVAFFKKLFGSNMVIPSSLNKLIK